MIRHLYPSFLAHPLVLIFGIFAGLSACKTLDPAASLPLLTVPSTRSEVNVPVEIPFSTLSRVVNGVAPAVLFRQRGVDLGNGLVGEFVFSRNGEIQLRGLDQQRLEVILPLTIQGEVGLKPGGIRNLLQTKVPISSNLAPVFVINPELQPNWYVGIPEFELLDLGGRPTLSVLGIELDLSTLVRQEIRRFAEQELLSKPNLLPLKPWVEPVWNQLGKPMLVEVEGRKIGLSIRPDSLKIREYLLPGKGLHLDLGFEGQVQIHPVTGLPTRAFPLPKLSPNTDASNRIALQLPFAFTYQEMDALIQNSFVGRSIPLNKNYRLLPTQFRTQAYGERLGITVSFDAVSNQGDTLTGELFLAGKPVYDPIAQEIRVENLDFVLKSGSAKAILGTLIKKGKIRKQLNQRLKIPFGEMLSVSRNGLEERLSLETTWVKGSIQDLKIVPLGFYPTSTGLTIPLQATGFTAIQWK